MAHKNSSNWSPYKSRNGKNSGSQATTPSARKGTKGAKGAKNLSSPKGPGGSEARAGTGPSAGSRTGLSAGISAGSRSKIGAGGLTGAANVARPERATRHRKPDENYSFAEADDRIYDIFRNHEFGDYPHEKRQALTRFYQMLMANQHEQNFTRLLSIRDVAIKHFIDSLIVTRFVDLKFPLLDMGTGPGFPGLPLSIHFQNTLGDGAKHENRTASKLASKSASKSGTALDIETAIGTNQSPKKIVLAEGVQRRVEFLKRVREELKLSDLPIVGRNVNIEFFYPVNGVITRAVEDARNTLGNVINCLQTGGSIYLMKGPNCEPEIEMALNQWGEFFELESNIHYDLPNSPHKRRLLVFKKIKPSPLPDFEELDLAWERENGSETY
jgi:16S rRNA (guanine527-N7)-methyltransferase